MSRTRKSHTPQLLSAFLAILVVVSMSTGFLAVGSSTAAAASSSNTTVEDWEDTDPYSEWETISGSPNITTELSQDGSHALKFGSDNSKAESLDGLNAYPDRGDTFVYHTYVNSTDGGSGFNFGRFQGNDHYQIALTDSDNFKLQKFSDGSTTELDSVSVGNDNWNGQWVKVEVKWQTEWINVTITTDSNTYELSAKDSQFDTGGVAVGSGPGASGTTAVYHDNITITDNTEKGNTTQTHSRYPFNTGSGSTAYDGVYDRDGTLTSGVSWVSGKEGSAVNVSGGSSIDFGDRRGFEAQTFTITMWVKPHSPGDGDDEMWVTKDDDGGTGPGFQLGIQNAGADVALKLRDLSGSAVASVSESASNFDKDNWTFVAVTVNDTADTVEYYSTSNGTFALRDEVTSSFGYDPDTSTSLFLGKRGDGYAPSDADFDEFRFYPDRNLNRSCLEKLSQDADYVCIDVSGSDSTTVTGQVVNQDNQPVDNATVEVYGIDYSKIESSQAQTLEERAHELVQQAKSPKPSEWDHDLQLGGSNGYFAKQSEPYVAVHTRAAWGLQSWTSTADTSSPLLQVPANTEVVFSTWDPAEEEGITEDGIERGLHGGVVDDTPIVIKTLAASGENISSVTLRTTQTKDVVFPGGEHDFATMSLPPGFYLVHPKGSPSTAYVIVSGEPDQIASAISKDLNSSASQLTDRAKTIRERVNNGTFTRTVVTTNSTGHFSVTISDPNVKTVAIQAYKKPPGMTTDAQNLTIQDVRTYWEVTDYNGSVVMPDETEVVNPPKRGVEVGVAEYSAPQYSNLSQFEQFQNWFDDFLEKSSYSETLSTLQQNLQNTQQSDLEDQYAALKRIAENNDDVRDRASELLGGEDVIIDETQASETELRSRIQAIQTAMANTRSTGDAGEPTTETGDGTVSLNFPLNGDVNPEDVAVFAHFGNGTTQTLTTDSEYVSVNSEVGNDEVVISDYPRPDNTSVQFSVRAATNNGLAKASKTIQAPGGSPQLASISLSTLRPGPNEDVDVRVNGAGDTKVTNLTSLTVYGPDGSSIATAKQSKTVGQFETAGEGVYFVKATFNTSDGKTATETFRVKAGDSPRNMPPGVRVMSSPLGTYALVGDGYDGGSVETSEAGSTLSVNANLKEAAKVPPETHVYTRGASLPADATVNVQVTRGADQQAVGKHVRVLVHMADFDTEQAVLYANDDPLPRQGENQNGRLNETADGIVISTNTDANGHLKIRTDANPSLTERAWYRAEVAIGDINVPSIDTTPPMPAGWNRPMTPGLGLSVLGAAALLARRTTR